MKRRYHSGRHRRGRKRITRYPLVGLKVNVPMSREQRHLMLRDLYKRAGMEYPKDPPPPVAPWRLINGMVLTNHMRYRYLIYRGSGV